MCDVAFVGDVCEEGFTRGTHIHKFLGVHVIVFVGGTPWFMSPPRQRMAFCCCVVCRFLSLLQREESERAQKSRASTPPRAICTLAARSLPPSSTLAFPRGFRGGAVRGTGGRSFRQRPHSVPLFSVAILGLFSRSAGVRGGGGGGREKEG